MLNYYKVITLYAEVLKNRKQSNETRKILQAFPKSVIISSAEKDHASKFFINRDFETKIAHIANDVNNLKKVEVKITKQAESNSEITEEYKTNILNFIKSQEERCSDVEISKHDNLKIIPQINLSNGSHPFEELKEPQIMDEQIHNVRTVKVEWEGIKSYMHVFSDITEIVKLDEAQNNI